jgi:phage replication initiation protein
MTVSNRCIIDFMSGTWSPLPLVRITQLARMGAKLKAVPVFITKSMERWYGFHDRNIPRIAQAFANRTAPAAMSHAGAREYQLFMADLYQQFDNLQAAASDTTRLNVCTELSRMMSDSLSEDEFIIEGGDFHDSYSDLIASYGVQWLDSLCCSEIESFTYLLNSHLSGHPSPVGPFYGRWTVQVRNGGMFGYTHSANILCDGQSAGLAAWGAANHGCLISFSGVGCAALDMDALHKVLCKLPGFKLTRVDVALDDFTGSAFDVEKARDWAQDGKFTKRRPPSYCYIESGHLTPSELVKAIGRKYGFDASKGKSFYVGSRGSGLMSRFYEKGKQMESVEFPNWQRAEVELRNVDRVIPLDVLINPDPIFAGAYPCLADLLQAVVPVAVKTIKGAVWSEFSQAWIEKIKASRYTVVKNAAIQCGRVLNYLSISEGLDSNEIISMLTGHLNPDDIPARLSIPIPQSIYNCITPAPLYGGMVPI